MRLTLHLISLLAMLLFGTGFWFTYRVPAGVENLATTFVQQRIEKEVGEKIESLSSAAQETKLGRLAQRISRGHEAEIAQLKEQLRAKAYAKSAEVIAKMRDPSCECRQNYAAQRKKALELHLSSLHAANAALLEFMQFKYMEVVGKLTRDWRIFTGVNFAIFAGLWLLSIIKPRAVAHLFLPGMLMVVATLVGSYFYLFEQNWFFTILYNDYVGWGYVAYVLGIFALLVDILLNRAKIATKLINGGLQMLGSALSVASC